MNAEMAEKEKINQLQRKEKEEVKASELNENKDESTNKEEKDNKVEIRTLLLSVI